MITLLQWTRPLASKMDNFIETFNEVANIFTLYLLMCFSDFVPERLTRNQVGWFFIGLLGVFASVHILIISRESLWNLFGKLKKKFGFECCKCLMKKAEPVADKKPEAEEAKEL